MAIMAIISCLSFYFSVNPDEIVAPPSNNSDSQDPLPEYKDKKEAIEAFKELLKDKVRLVPNTYQRNKCQEKA